MRVYIYFSGSKPTVCLYDTTSPVELVDTKAPPAKIHKVDRDTVLLDFDAIAAIVIFASDPRDSRDESPRGVILPETDPPALVPEPTAEELGAILDRSVHALDLSARILNALVGHGIETIRQLVLLETPELSAIRRLGSAAVRDVKAALSNLGLRLGMVVPREPGTNPLPVPDSRAQADPLTLPPKDDT